MTSSVYIAIAIALIFMMVISYVDCSTLSEAFSDTTLPMMLNCSVMQQNSPLATPSTAQQATMAPQSAVASSNWLNSTPHCNRWSVPPSWQQPLTDVIETHIRHDKWLGNAQLPPNTMITLSGFTTWDLPDTLKDKDPQFGMPRNFGVQVRYRFIDPATQKPPTVLYGSDAFGVKEFRVLGTWELNEKCNFKILMVTPY
jgi:hypothetical protein